MPKVSVNLKKIVDSSYTIDIDSGFYLQKINQLKDKKKIHIISDSNVAELYLRNIEEEVLEINASEDNKTFATVMNILDFLRKRNCIREDLLIAVGGGITGDIAAFAASMYMRGIKYVHFPTTLLSMVDSSVGGKTGINYGDVKNLIGAFYQPTNVYIDINFLNTLPEDEFFSGMGEIIKYACMFDKNIYNTLISSKDDILSKRTGIIIDLIEKCCSIKARVVEEDEKEQGIRRYLNYGHTFGHAIEVDSHHSVKHGHAIATGMYIENLFAAKYQFSSSAPLEEIKNILSLYNYPLEYKIKHIDTFIAALLTDKKAKSNGLAIALTDTIGNGKIIEGITVDYLQDFFHKGF